MLGTRVGIRHPIFYATIEANESPHIAVIKQADSGREPKIISKEIKKEAAVLPLRSVIPHEFEVISCHIVIRQPACLAAHWSLVPYP